jgi:hypothetical protein
VVVRGPIGVGSRALAYHVAVRAITRPQAAEVAAIATWDFTALRLTRESPKVGEWLPAELGQLRGPTIILVEDLPKLLTFEGVAQTLQLVLRHPSLRILATADTDSYRQVLRDFPAIAETLTSVTLEPPRPDIALSMVEAHRPRLEQRYRVTLTADAVGAAVEQWRDEAPLVLPGAALARLERACARAVGQSIGDGGDLHASAGPHSRPAPHAPGAGASQMTRPMDDQPVVTGNEVRTAAR